MSQRDEILSALTAAAQAPIVPFFGRLTAGLVAAGFKIVPRDLWETLTRKVLVDDPSRVHDGQLYHGFLVRKNHVRSEQHEYWQTTILPETLNPVWVIPVEEFMCLAYEDMEAHEFVSITRLIFTGTEEQLREAVAAMPMIH